MFSQSLHKLCWWANKLRSVVGLLQGWPDQLWQAWQVFTFSLRGHLCSLPTPPKPCCIHSVDPFSLTHWSPSEWQHNHLLCQPLLPVWIIYRIADGMLCTISRVINEKQYWHQYWPLGAPVKWLSASWALGYRSKLSGIWQLSQFSATQLSAYFSVFHNLSVRVLWETVLKALLRSR